MKIICIAGLMGSGKDSVALHISEKYGWHIIDFSNTLREICRKEGMEVNRDNLQGLRLKYGNTFLAEAVVKKAREAANKKIILGGLRRSEDFLIAKKEFPQAKLIVVEAPLELRFGRLFARGRENDPKTIEEFRRQEKREFEIYDFGRLFSYADYRIENAGTLESLKSKIDEIMKEAEK